MCRPCHGRQLLLAPGKGRPGRRARLASCHRRAVPHHTTPHLRYEPKRASCTRFLDLAHLQAGREGNRLDKPQCELSLLSGIRLEVYECLEVWSEALSVIPVPPFRQAAVAGTRACNPRHHSLDTRTTCNERPTPHPHPRTASTVAAVQPTRVDR